MKFWQRGLSVIYESLALIIHYESASSDGNDNATAVMAAHQEKFRSKRSVALKRHYTPSFANVCGACVAANSPGLRIVYIDDHIPHRAMGAGFLRGNVVVTALPKMGHHVTGSSSTTLSSTTIALRCPWKLRCLTGAVFDGSWWTSTSNALTWCGSAKRTTSSCSGRKTAQR